MIDFKKKLANGNTEKMISPIDIYSTLDRKSIAGPLRTPQHNILSEWFLNRYDEKDLIVKLHTGEGKTLIGLLMLQSKLNKNNEPCLYICPNIYLVEQVCSEAEKFGIGYCKIEKGNDIPNEFICGEKILIIHAQKLFNGKSIFEMDKSLPDIGTIILDDSHACIDAVKQAFTITVNRTENEALYNKFLLLFKDDLLEQGEGSFIDIENGESGTFMPIPYWSWIDQRKAVLEILSEHSKDTEIQFVWQLLRDKIHEYGGYISGTKLEICSYSPNVNVFGSFSKAKHRILMSATTQDDAFFIKGLSFSKDAVLKPLINSEQKWSGEKMVLIPSLVDDANDTYLIINKFAKEKYDKFGAVALVPSTKRANYYNDLGAIVADKNSISTNILGLKDIKTDKMLVINNRYDGIDLPDESCRILIIDSIPYFNSLAYKYEEQCRPTSVIINKLIAQKIEQGLGRGVRGEKDYCAIIIIGSDLVKFIRNPATNKFFSLQTSKQIEIGLKLAKMASEVKKEDESALTPIISLIDQMLKRDEGWKAFYQNEMNSISEDNDRNNIYENLAKEAEIEQLFSSLEYEKASASLQSYINELKPEGEEKGWYLQQLARFLYFLPPKENSLKTQQSAFKSNSKVLKPRVGISYNKISYINENRMNNIKKYLSKFKDFHDLQLEIDNILANLRFSTPAEQFEGSLQQIGKLLGYKSQRPDKKIRKGPDNLWCGVDNKYLLFECKNGVGSGHREISKRETGQMNNHSAWFEREYGIDAQVTYFLIINTRTLSYQGDFMKKVRIIKESKLNELKNQVKDFINELKNYNLLEISSETLQNFIDIHNLNNDDFINKYSEEYYCKK